MHIAPKVSVRTNLAIAILATIVLSWVLSTGIANYANYLNMRSFRQQMLDRPDLYPRPFPEPHFGIIEFFTGRPPFPRGPGHHPPMNESNGPMRDGSPRMNPGTLPSQMGLPNGPIPGEPGMVPGQGSPPMGIPNGPIPGGSPGMNPGQGGPPMGGPDGPMPEGEMETFEAKILALRFAIALGLAILAGILLGQRFTHPLMQLSKGADAFQAGDFEYRIPAASGDEFAAVAETMNQMASQVSAHIKSLEKDAESRRKFLADIAHELRSPVTTMRTMAGALQDGVAEEPERRDRAVSALVRTSERMLRLVQDLMELAKLDLNELPLNVKYVDLSELVGSVVHSHEVESKAAGTLLQPFVSTSPIRAKVDPDRITQVLDNILENAVSYAGYGAEVSVAIEKGKNIKITVADTGKGIRAEDLPYIFDSFYRADTARTPSDSHSGLGLSIARKLVEVHGGTLNISSEEGKGTTVTIELPVESA